MDFPGMLWVDSEGNEFYERPLESSYESTPVSIGLVKYFNASDFSLNYMKIGEHKFEKIKNMDNFNTWGYMVQLDEHVMGALTYPSSNGIPTPVITEGKFVVGYKIRQSCCHGIELRLDTYQVTQNASSLRVRAHSFRFNCFL
jgi:hypothetical protein